MNARRRLTAAALAAAGCLGAAKTAAAQSTPALSFCAGADNSPMSQERTSDGIEVEFARALAAEMGAEAAFVWLDAHTESIEQAVLNGRCDAALGAIVDPGPMAGSRALDGVALTAPYYHAGYVLIRGAATRPLRTLAELGGRRVAVERESIATFSLRQQGRRVHVLHDYQAVVAAVADHRVEYGYLWGPIAAWALRNRRDVVVSEGFIASEQWGFALAVRDRDALLRRRLNRAIRALADRDAVLRIAAAYAPAGIAR